MPLFDFDYALEVHSGLQNWILVEGNPENFQIEKPVVYIQNEDPEFIQRAVFVREADDTVNMSMNDAPRIINLDMAYMKILYVRPTYGEYPDA
jgi:hypothetical protein